MIAILILAVGILISFGISASLIYLASEAYFEKIYKPKIKYLEDKVSYRDKELEKLYDALWEATGKLRVESGENLTADKLIAGIISVDSIKDTSK